MKVTLTKAAQWDGKSHKSGTDHDVSDAVAKKLLSRGYAKKFVKKAEKDGPATDK